MKILLPLLLLAVLLAGCAYSPSDVDDFDIKCPYCSEGFTVHKTTINCRADSVLITACETPCRRCGRMLAEPGDDVSMTALSGGVSIIQRGGQR